MKLFDATDWGKFSFYLDENGRLLKRGFWFIIPRWLVCFIMIISSWIIYDSVGNYRGSTLINILFHDFCVLIFFLMSFYGMVSSTWLMHIANFSNYFDKARIIVQTILTLFMLILFLLFEFFILLITDNIWIVKYFK